MQGTMASTNGVGHDRIMSGKVAVQLGIDICRGLQDVHAAGMVMGNLAQVCTPTLYILILSAATHVQAILSQHSAHHRPLYSPCCWLLVHHHLASARMLCISVKGVLHVVATLSACFRPTSSYATAAQRC